MTALLLHDVEVDGLRGLDVRIEDGRIAAIGTRLAGAADAIDARGGALIPGLADHHVHLLATAARDASLALDDVSDEGGLETRLRATLAARPAGAWLRATGLAPALAETLDPALLDRWAPCHPLRVQDQSGALWLVNRAALERLGGGDLPPGVEREADGRPTGRLWRADAWLRARLEGEPPSLAPLGARLAGWGVTALTDASASTDASAAALLAGACRAGALPQRLTLMSAGPLAAPEDGAFAVGPVKLLLDERDLPPPEAVEEVIRGARAQRRRVAVHCVTAAELAVTLAAFEGAGALPGDRVEHGGVIPDAALAPLHALGPTVVTQPGFVSARGDRYLAEVDPHEQGDLWRCASLIAAGVPVAGSSDAPYGPTDPWEAMRTAVARRTRAGAVLGAGERVAAARALALWLGDVGDPGGPARRVTVGAAADLCLLRVPLDEALAGLDAGLVAATIVAGRVVAGSAGG